LIEQLHFTTALLHEGKGGYFLRIFAQAGGDILPHDAFMAFDFGFKALLQRLQQLSLFYRGLHHHLLHTKRISTSFP